MRDPHKEPLPDTIMQRQEDIASRVARIVADDITSVRVEQDAEYPSGASNSPELWAAILGKQVGKVAAAALDISASPSRDSQLLRANLCHVAAVAVAWWEAIEHSYLPVQHATRLAGTFIAYERLRQEKKFTISGTCAGHEMTVLHKYAVLAEEVGEATADVVEIMAAASGGVYKGTATPETLRKELIQVAAVAVAWIESIDY